MPWHRMLTLVEGTFRGPSGVKGPRSVLPYPVYPGASRSAGSVALATFTLVGVFRELSSYITIKRTLIMIMTWRNHPSILGYRLWAAKTPI